MKRLRASAQTIVYVPCKHGDLVAQTSAAVLSLVSVSKPYRIIMFFARDVRLNSSFQMKNLLWNIFMIAKDL